MVFFQWDYQYLLCLTSDGSLIKINIEDENTSFTSWNFDRFVALDVEVVAAPDEEDLIYVVVDRDGVSSIEVLINNQHIRKHYHGYDCFRHRDIEAEYINEYSEMILANYVKNSTHNDCAITMNYVIKDHNATLAINGSKLTITGKTDLKTSDIIVLNDDEFYIKYLDPKNPQEALIDNPKNIVVQPTYINSFHVKQSKFLLTTYPGLSMFANKQNISICADGKVFHTSPYSIFVDSKEGSFSFDNDQNLILNGAAFEITIGYVYRFLLVDAPVTSVYNRNPGKKRTINTAEILFSNTYQFDVGTDIRKLDPKRLRPGKELLCTEWISVSICNADSRATQSLIVKTDAPAPLELVCIHMKYNL